MARLWPCPGAAGVLLSLGTGCLYTNPGFDEPTGASASTGAPTSGPDATTAAASSSGVGSTSGGTTDASTGGSAGASTGTSAALSASSSGSTTFEPTTGEASSGSAAETAGGPQFCMAGVQAEMQCQALGDTPWMVCDAARDWPGAQAGCDAICGQLGVLTSEAERTELFAALEARMTPEEQAKEPMIPIPDQEQEPLASYWIGASAPGAQQPFTWVDGTPLASQPGVDGWALDDPDWSGLCVVIAVWGKQAGDGRWYDRNCTLKYRYVCEPKPL